MITHRRTFLKHLGLGVGGLGLAAGFAPTLNADPLFHRTLPRSAPEAQGVRSEGILNFLKAIGGSNHEFHSFMMVRRGHVIAEGWWSPYRADLTHMLYSLSKSFTSTAVGLAKAEGKLDVEDRVISFFPDKLPAEVGDNLKALKVRHLLSMAVGHAQDSTPSITKEDDWVRTFLSLPIANPPGTAFLYNSGATYMLSAIVQKVTGQKVVDFLKPRLFDPLGIRGMTWETCPQGINTGGWGLSVRTEDLARFGQLYLQNGAWNNHPIVPSSWVADATSFKIQQPGADLEKLKRESDWHQGYCYQFWRCRHNAFRGDGAFGQYTIVMPDQEAVIAITGESSNMQGEMNLVWEHLLPAIEQTSLKPDTRMADALAHELAHLELTPPKGQPSSPMAAAVSGKRFNVKDDAGHVQAVEFEFHGDRCLFTLTDDQGSYPVACGFGKWISGQTEMPGEPPKLTKSSGKTMSQIAAAAAWKDDAILEMTWRFIETPHHDTVSCRFDGDAVKVTFLNSVARLSNSHKETRQALVGQLS